VRLPSALASSVLLEPSCAYFPAARPRARCRII
jgi:hypothetical protein